MKFKPGDRVYWKLTGHRGTVMEPDSFDLPHQLYVYLDIAVVILTNPQSLGRLVKKTQQDGEAKRDQIPCGAV